jgi:rubrerythrin
MNPRNQLHSLITFQVLLFLPVTAAFLVIAFFFGCQKAPEQKEAKPTVTIENLQTAQKKEVKLGKMYSLFVAQAVKEKNKQVASLFRAIGRSEEIHAKNHIALLKKQGVEPQPSENEAVVVGSTLQTLKMALSSEQIEAESMYPNLARSAAAEKVQEAADQFKRTMDADTRHEELIKDALDKSGKVAKCDYFVCPDCGYICTSDKTDECPVCHAQKATFISI